jgi:hypothetical protein
VRRRAAARLAGAHPGQRVALVRVQREMQAGGERRGARAQPAARARHRAQRRRVQRAQQRVQRRSGQVARVERSLRSRK